MNLSLLDSELGFNFRLFCKTNSNLATWQFDRFRLYNPKWHTKIQIRRPDGSVLATKDFSAGGFEHTFSFDLSENITNQEYSVYIAGVPAGAKFDQLYAWPSGYSATYGKDADLTFLDLSQVVIQDSGTSGRIRAQNQPLNSIVFNEVNNQKILDCIEVRFPNCQLDAETLADLIIAVFNSGVVGGTLDYSGNLAAPAERALAAYNDLKAAGVRNWSVIGEVPADAPAYDPDYQAVLDYLTANGITTPSQAQIDIDNDLMLYLKSSGIWAKSDGILKTSGSGEIAYKLVDWKRLIQADAFGGLTWSNSGVKGNGTNGYIDFKFTPSSGVNFLKDSGGILYVKKENIQSTGSEVRSAFGVFDANGGINILANRVSGAFFRINSSSSQAAHQGGNYERLGLNMLNRLDASNLEFKGNAVIPIASNSIDRVSSHNLSLLARNNAGTRDSFAVDSYGFFAIGGNYSGDFDTIKTKFDAI